MIAALLTLAILPGLDDILEKDAKVVEVATGYVFTEGAAWTRDNKLVFNDIPANKIYAWGGATPTVFRDPSGNSNGNVIGPDGLLYTAHHGSRNITRTNQDGSVTVLADKFEGKRLSSPNDLVVRKNGDVYFTDPPYGLGRTKPDLDFNGVFVVRKDGKVEVLAKDFARPNGIAFSPDEKVCYVADTQNQQIRAFDLDKNGLFTNGRVFAEKFPGYPDGIRVDTKGNLYVTAQGVHVFDPKGTMLGTIPVPETPTNCAWGDKDGKTLYLTAQKSIYRIRCKVKGLRF